MFSTPPSFSGSLGPVGDRFVLVEGVLAERRPLGVLHPGQFVDHALEPELGVDRLDLADEDGDCPALRHHLLDQPPDGLPRFVVIGADVAEPAALGGVVVHRNEVRLAGDLLEVRGLLLRVDDADRDPIDALGDQFVHDVPLECRVALVGPAEDEFDAVLLGGVLGTLLGDGPEVFRVIGDERHLDLAGVPVAGREEGKDNRAGGGQDGSTGEWHGRVRMSGGRWIADTIRQTRWAASKAG